MGSAFARILNVFSFELIRGERTSESEVVLVEPMDLVVEVHLGEDLSWYIKRQMDSFAICTFVVVAHSEFSESNVVECNDSPKKDEHKAECEKQEFGAHIESGMASSQCLLADRVSQRTVLFNVFPPRDFLLFHL